MQIALLRSISLISTKTVLAEGGHDFLFIVCSHLFLSFVASPLIESFQICLMGAPSCYIFLISRIFLATCVSCYQPSSFVWFHCVVIKCVCSQKGLVSSYHAPLTIKTLVGRKATIINLTSSLLEKILDTADLRIRYAIQFS